MGVTYKIQDKDFRDYGIIVESYEGLYDDLEKKDLHIEDIASQHGVLVDLSAIRYKERRASLNLAFFERGVLARSNRNDFISLFIGSTPKRLERIEDNCNNTKHDVWDVVLSGGNLEVIHSVLEKKKLLLIEPAPIKNVYEVTGNASFTLAPMTTGETQQPVLISWGDGNFTQNCRAGSFTHTYTDGYDKHYIILSGVMEEVVVTTEHTELKTVRH